MASMELADLLPESASCRELWGSGDPATLLPAEAACTVGFAQARLCEFAAGRWCAGLALADLGAASAPLLVGSDREPLWPDGFTGSITHTDRYCAAAVSRTGEVLSLGIDAERIVAIERAVWQKLFRPAEIDWLDSLAQLEQLSMACAVFSGKEAYFKCQFPLTRRWLDFHDVELRFDGQSFAVLHRDADPGYRLVGTYGVVGDARLVATTVVATRAVAIDANSDA